MKVIEPEFVHVKFTKQDVINSARKLITKGGRPLKAVEDEGYKILTDKIINAFNEKYPRKRFTINRHNVQKHIDAAANNLRELISDEVSFF